MWVAVGLGSENEKGTWTCRTWKKEITLPTTPKHTLFSNECVILSSIDCILGQKNTQNKS